MSPSRARLLPARRPAVAALVTLVAFGSGCSGSLTEPEAPPRARPAHAVTHGDESWGVEEDLTGDPFRAEVSAQQSDDPVGEFFLSTFVVVFSLASLVLPLFLAL